MTNREEISIKIERISDPFTFFELKFIFHSKNKTTSSKPQFFNFWVQFVATGMLDNIQLKKIASVSLFFGSLYFEWFMTSF